MSAWSWPPRAPASLDCSHCGDVAIESASGLFRDGDGVACMSCGHPGHVSVDEDEGAEDEVTVWAVARWRLGSGPCDHTWCDECLDLRLARGAS